MMPLPRPWSVGTVTTLGCACLTICTTGAKGSAAAGADVEPASPDVLPARLAMGVAAGVSVADDVWPQPTTRTRVNRSASALNDKRGRNMAANFTPRSGKTAAGPVAPLLTVRYQHDDRDALCGVAVGSPR